MEETVTQRLNLLVDTFEKGIKSSFANRIGISQQGAHDLLNSRKGGPSFKVLTKVLEGYPQIRIEWLVLGKGPMLQSDEALAAPASITVDGQAHPLTWEQWEVLKKAIIETTPAKAAAQVETEWLSRTYHFGDEPTPGLDYDDRIAKRLNLNKQERQEWLDSPEFKEVPHTKIGSRIIITERGVRELLGDLPKVK